MIYLYELVRGCFFSYYYYSKMDLILLLVVAIAERGINYTQRAQYRKEYMYKTATKKKAKNIIAPNFSIANLKEYI